MTFGRRLVALSVLCVCAAVLLVSVETTAVFQWMRTPPDYASEGQQLTGHVLTTYDNTYMVTQCARRCLISANCASYNFLPALNRCEISDESHLTFPQDLTLSDDAQYYLRDAYTIDKLALGPCADHPCLNGGTCLTSSPSNGVLSFYCFCTEGWTGSTCSDKANVIAWSEWSAWSSCSSSCGDGVQMRARNCVDVSTAAKRSPQSCYGRDQEEQHCWTQQCPYWSPWSDWGACITATGCGAGKQLRMRTCTNGGTAGVDRLCLGPINETTPCQFGACDAPVRLQEGSTYGEGRVDVYDDVTSTWLPVCADDGWTKQDADVVCAQLELRSGAQQVKNYPIQDGGVAAAQYVIIGFSCTGSESRLASCPLQTWHGASCPAGQYAGVECIVDGRWSAWSEWGTCSVTCASGMSTRTRQCNSPPSLRGGKDCVANGTESRPCTQPPCPVDASWDIWQEWNQCSKSCGNGTQSRTRDCILGKFGGSNCTGQNQEIQNCNAQPCPVDGVWSDWTDWTQCNVSCGGGSSSRTRTCAPPQYGGATCNGSSTEVQICNTKSCAVDGVWKEWGSWSGCTATCGSGTKIRLRNCTGPFYGGKPCSGPLDHQAFCNDDPCPVDGEWTAWSRWSDCSASCSVGSQTSYRKCSTVQNGGKVCPGNLNRNQSCDAGPCPVDCVWMEWSAWSLCNVTCGGGLSWRSRSSSPELYGGAPCNESADDSVTCNTNPCPIPGEWVTWSPWSSCSATCGLGIGGQRTRTRTCNMTTYGSLTLPCLPLGGENEAKRCHDFNCYPTGKNCKEYYGRGLEDNVTYVTIDPDQDTGMNPEFQVLCQRDDAGLITMTIHNRMENGTNVQGTLTPFFLREFKVQYIDRSGSNVTIDQLIGMVDGASYCRQYISWKCFTAPMNSNSSSITVQLLVYWKNRYYESMGFWGDTTTTDYIVRANSGMTCSCGEKKSCGRPDLKCACDLNDAVWRNDSGYLTQSNHLPVTTYCVTDTGNAAYKGSFEVGPLVCYN